MAEVDFDDFASLVTRSRFPVLDVTVYKLLEASRSAFQTSLAQWREENRVGPEGVVFESRLSYHTAFAPGREAFERGVSQLQDAVEAYAKLGPILPTHYLVHWFTVFYGRSQKVRMEHALTAAIVNSLVEVGRLAKLRRLDYEGELSTSTHHPTYGAFVASTIDFCIAKLLSEGRFEMGDLRDRGRNLERRRPRGDLYRYGYWAFSITGYLEYLGLGQQLNTGFVSPYVSA